MHNFEVMTVVKPFPGNVDEDRETLLVVARSVVSLWKMSLHKSSVNRIHAALWERPMAFKMM